jgi:predicted Zn-dependent protease
MTTLKNLLNSLNIDVEYIALREVESRSLSLSVRNEIFEGMKTFYDHGIMVEVMVRGQFAYAATNSFDPSEVKACALRARTLAEHASKHSLHHFSLNERPVVVGEYKLPNQKSFDSFQSKDMHDLLLELSRKIKVDEKVITRSSNFSLVETTTHFVSNTGSSIHQTIVRSAIGLTAVASDGPKMQTRSWGHDLNSQHGLEKINRENLMKEADRIGNEARELLAAEECPTGAMDLLLAPDEMYLQIHESIGHPLELDRILGDERNYAGWSFIKPGDFGKLQYGSKLMNITFDPTLPYENASYFADDIGNRATKEFIIKDGVLLRGLGSLESQKRLGLPGVASQRATSWNRPPIDRMANINLEPGNSTLQDMISNVEQGVFMQSNRSWSIDDYRNKFQFGCEYGKLIENGKLTKTVKNPNYRGITTPFWNSLKMVGDRTTFEVGGLSNCGKGEPNQAIFVGHASPVCLFSNIEVFGGGK